MSTLSQMTARSALARAAVRPLKQNAQTHVRVSVLRLVFPANEFNKADARIVSFFASTSKEHENTA
jgi:hypothetical protein